MKSSFLLKLFFYAVAISFFLTPLVSEARGWGRWAGPGFNYGHWRGGYWYHGGYGPRVGWWWVVGPSWYYYAEPVYPYPSPETAPIYYTQVGSAPPPAATSPIAGAVPSATLPNGAKGQAFSYYCAATKGYYPIVSTCESGWIASPVKAPN